MYIVPLYRCGLCLSVCVAYKVGHQPLPLREYSRYLLAALLGVACSSHSRGAFVGHWELSECDGSFVRCGSCSESAKIPEFQISGINVKERDRIEG